MNKENKLIACPVCNNDISTDAALCPHCGHTLKEPQTAVGLVAAIILGLVIFALLKGCIEQ